MKSSLHTDHLSPKELSDLVSGKLDAQSNARVKKLLNDCELSKEAVAGFTAVPGAINDLSSLNKQIGKNAGLIKTPLWMSIVTVVIGVSLVAGMGYALWPREPEITEIPYSIPQTNLPTPIVSSVVDLTPKAEHFVNPEAKPEPQAKLSQGKIEKKDSVKSSPEKSEPIAVSEPEKVIEKPIVPKNPEPGYNGSIGFIFDLKITEFEKYYRKTIEVREPVLKGVPAEFEDGEKLKADGSEKETVRNVPAEQFLNEGLRAFHDGKYGKCIEKMEVLKKNNEKDMNASFYMGVSYVKLEMFEKAIAMFDEVINSTNNVFREEASWYKALALIGNGNKEAAKIILTEIAGKEGFYKEKAVVKLREL